MEEVLVNLNYLDESNIVNYFTLITLALPLLTGTSFT